MSKHKIDRINNIANTILEKWEEKYPVPDTEWTQYNPENFSSNSAIKAIEKKLLENFKSDQKLEEEIKKIQAPFQEAKKRVKNKINEEKEKLLDLVTFSSDSEVLLAIQDFINMEVK